MKKALIAGSTGLVGKSLIELLEKEDAYDEIHVLVRREVSSFSEKIHQHVVNFDQLDQFSLNTDIQDIYCCLGTTMKKAGSKEAFRKVDHDYVVNTARLGLRLNGQQFLVVSAIGADKDSSIFYNRVKGEMEEAIAQIGYPTVHIFQPSMLDGDRGEFRFGEWLGSVFMKITAPLWVGKLKNYKIIHADKVALSMLKAAKENRKGVTIHASGEMNAVVTS